MAIGGKKETYKELGLLTQIQWISHSQEIFFYKLPPEGSRALFSAKETGGGGGKWSLWRNSANHFW